MKRDLRRELDVKREEMNKIIKFELGYIPKGSRGSIQNKLRFYYNAYRRRDLARGKQREESLASSNLYFPYFSNDCLEFVHCVVCHESRLIHCSRSVVSLVEALFASVVLS